VEIMIKHVSHPLEPPRQRNPHVEITDNAEAVIMKCLEKRPSKRYQTMEELNRDLPRCFGSVRFRRPVRPPEEGTFESMRQPIPLTREKKRPTLPPPEGAIPQRVRTTPSTALVIGDEPPSGPSPILLTRRKSGRHDTLTAAAPLVEDDDVESAFPSEDE
jgi:serine/threonine protein kinase